MLSVIPFECQKSSLAAALGKLKQRSQSGKDFRIEIWNICPILSYSNIYGMKKHVKLPFVLYSAESKSCSFVSSWTAQTYGEVTQTEIKSRMSTRNVRDYQLYQFFLCSSDFNFQGKQELIKKKIYIYIYSGFCGPLVVCNTLSVGP